MKKFLLSALIAVLVLFCGSIYAQKASATWLLTETSAAAATTEGQVNAADETVSNLVISYKILSGAGETTTLRRFKLASSIQGGYWSDTNTDEIQDVYVQYAISPKTGNKLTIDSFRMDLWGQGTGSVKANVYYSTDPAFATKTKVNDPGLTAGLPYQFIASPFTLKVSSINMQVEEDQKFYIRVYPYVPVNSNTKYLSIRNIVIKGTTGAVPQPFSVLWPYETDQSFVNSGPVLGQAPAFGDSLKHYGFTSLNFSGTSQSTTLGAVQTVSKVWFASSAPKEKFYFQYAVSPKTGGTMEINKISFNIGGWYSANLNAAVYYSKDASFTDKKELMSAFPLAGSAVERKSAALNETVNSGETFYLRFYPYNSANEGWAKLVVIDSVKIAGTVTGATFDPPILTTNDPSFISRSFATTGGNISSDGGAPVTERGIVRNTTGSPTIADQKIVAGSGSGQFKIQITGLADTTKYFIRAYAINSVGTSYGNEVSLTTLNNIYPPSVSTAAISNAMVKTAQSGGNVIAWGGDTITTRGICWSTSNPPTISDSKTIDGSGLGSFVSGLTGLSQNTTYYVRAYATSKAGGTGYGSVISFTTQSPAADVTKVVAKDGSGDYLTIKEAFDAVQANYTGKWIIKIKPGTYYEKVTLASNKPNVYLIGENPDSTILTYDAYSGQSNGTGGTWGTSGSFSVSIDAPDFTAMNITFRNTIKNDNTHTGGEQAVALRTNGDRQSYYNCKIMGFQDTYYSYGLGRVYMKYCYLEGSVDFIFGQSTVVFDSCELRCNRNGGVLTAPNTPAGSSFGYVFRRCRISSPEKGFDGNTITGFYLGRAWQNNPKSVYLFCQEPASLAQAGWTNMTGGLNPLFAEYNCSGDGFKPLLRSTNADYKGIQLTDAQASNYKISNIFAKSTNPAFVGDWMPDTAVYSQKISFPLIPARKVNDAFTLNATASSGLAVTYSSSDPAVAEIMNGNTVKAKSAGTVFIKASQSGNLKYISARDSVVQLVISPSTGINSFQKAGINIYPNPASSTIFIERKNFPPQEMILMDSKGLRILRYMLVNEKESVDISGLPSGTYFIKIQENTFKILKQ